MFDSVFGIHERALELRSQRMEILSRNIANADTPNFKARDLDFSKVLSEPKIVRQYRQRMLAILAAQD